MAAVISFYSGLILGSIKLKNNQDFEMLLNRIAIEKEEKISGKNY